MKFFIRLIIPFLFSFSAFSQSKMSPQTSILLNKVSENPQLSKQNDIVSGLMKVSSEIDIKKLQDLNIKIGTKAGNIWTFRIPLMSLNSLSSLKGIEYLQVNEGIHSTMDSVLAQSRIDSVHNGINLPKGFTGKDVIVGIIDAGFDYRHPAFYDVNGQNYRVKKIWAQNSLIQNPPNGFSYGEELRDTNLFSLAETDVSLTSHGSHVTGIAAGSGYGSPGNKYKGIAYESDLVFVGIKPAKSSWINTGMAEIIDGISYIFQYADSMNKPAVINLSWGCSMGPHDGTSLFNQALENLTGKGKIFVCSAGNNGGENIHLSKSFSNTDTVLNTFLTFPGSLPEKRIWVDSWGENAKTFCIEIKLYNGSSLVSSGSKFCTSSNSVSKIFLPGTNSDTCYVDISCSSSEFNQKPRIFMDFLNRTNHSVVIKVTSNSGTVQLWNGMVIDHTGYYGTFSNGGMSWASSGNVLSTIGDMASGKSAIAVGAYASKNIFTNTSSQNINYTGYVQRGALAPFSSKGPSIDNRVKPDITAPGFIIASSVSSQDLSWDNSGLASVVVNFTHPVNGRIYKYAMLQGTSMSSPVVSGVVALMLQANPDLNVEDVKAILAQTARADNFTGNVPNNNWGPGKLNAFRAVASGISLTAPAFNKVFDLIVFPNPGNGNYSIQIFSESKKAISFEVYSSSGIKILSNEYLIDNGIDVKELNLSKEAPGLYLLRVKIEEEIHILRLVKF